MASTSKMDSDADRFDLSGPTHMMPTAGSSATMIDWDNEEHRRCIAACIVKSTYILEKDRTTCRPKALAPVWWESFHFRIVNVLSDDCEVIFGAIYEHVPPEGTQHHPSALKEL